MGSSALPLKEKDTDGSRAGSGIEYLVAGCRWVDSSSPTACDDRGCEGPNISMIWSSLRSLDNRLGAMNAGCSITSSGGARIVTGVGSS